MFKKNEAKVETKKEDCTVKVGFTFYPDSNQILISYLQNCSSTLAAKYFSERMFNNIDVDLRLNEVETFEDPDETRAKAAEEAKKAAEDKEAVEKKEEPKEEDTQQEPTKEQKEVEDRKKKVAELRDKREKGAVKFIASLDREKNKLIVKNSQNCDLKYWVNYISWRVKDQTTMNEIAKLTTLKLVDTIIKDKKKSGIVVPGA